MPKLTQTIQDFLAIYQVIDTDYTVADLEKEAEQEHYSSSDDAYNPDAHFEHSALEVLTYAILNEIEYNYEVRTSERFVSGEYTEIKVNSQQIVDVDSYNDFIENAKAIDTDGGEWDD